MEIKLIAVNTEKDEDGFPVEKKCEVEAYAKEKSVTRTELYESMRAGVTAKMVYEIRQEDWNRAKELSDDKYVRKIEDEDGVEHDLVKNLQSWKSNNRIGVWLKCSKTLDLMKWQKNWKN